MPRLTLQLLPAALLLGCGDPATTTSATTGGNESSTGITAGPSTTDDTPTTTPTTGTSDAPTGGSGSATDSATGTTTPDPTGSTSEPGTTTTTGPETTASTTADTTGDTTTTGDDSSTGPIDGSSSSSSTGDVEACGCPDLEVALDDGIFVLSSTADLWKYYPESNTFEELGTIACPGLVSTFSMAVDRLGFAWVQFTGGELRKINVGKVGECTDPGFVLNQQGVQNFGMAFVSNSESDACDRIYGNTYSGIGGYTEAPNAGDFITIDPDSLALAKLGKTNFDGAEVTGTGDGRAFVFGGVNPSKLVELDKAKGTVVQTLPLDGLEINNSAFAFAFFAGDFYFFTDSNADFTASEVTHLDFDDSDNNGKQDLTLLTDDAPLLIVGAGVSTCAPTAPQ